MIVTIIITLISAVIAVLTFFATMAIRRVAIVVLVAVAPIAFVCYALPNTKKLFEKWFKLFKSMLVIYPICGFLVGAGTLVNVIIAGSGEFFAGICGICAMVIPFFFIPSLVKGSLSLMGNVGAKLSKLSQAGGQKLRNTEFAKDAKIRAQAGVNKKGDLTAIGRAKGKFANSKLGKTFGYNSAYSRSRSKALSQTEARVAADRINSASGYEAARMGLERKAEDALINDEIVRMKGDTKNYSTDTMKDNLQNILNKGNKATDEEKIRAKAYIRKLSSNGDGTRELNKLISSGNIEEGGRQYLAQCMVDDDKAMSAVRSKSAANALYLQDIAQGKFKGTRDQWDTHTDSRRGGVSNLAYVANEIIDKEQDLLSQSNSEVQKLMPHLSDDRVERLGRYVADPKNTAGYSKDNIEAIEAEYARRFPQASKNQSKDQSEGSSEDNKLPPNKGHDDSNTHPSNPPRNNALPPEPF